MTKEKEWSTGFLDILHKNSEKEPEDNAVHRAELS